MVTRDRQCPGGQFHRVLNLRAGIEALRGQGARAERVLLIGGASASKAVQHLAANIFGVPVAVPEPGEYVGIGAARQAAGACSGSATAPQWPMHLAAEASEDGVVETLTETADIVGRYEALLATMHQK